MMRLAAFLLCLGLFVEVSALAIAAIGEAITGAPVTVAVGKTTTLSVPGTTAAYSLNSSVAEASAENGLVHVRGIGGGSTGIVVVTATGTTTIIVSVPAQRASSSSQAASSAAGVQQGGYVESSYNSNAGQVNTTIQLQRRDGDLFRRFWAVTQTFVRPDNGRGTGFPLLSYEIRTPGRDVTLLDKLLTVSPLTFSGALVRGVHVNAGPWSVHAGASSVAQFGEFLIPAQPQWVFGVTRGVALSEKSALSANLYDIVNADPLAPTRAGTLGSIVYSAHPNRRLNALAEIGISRSIAFDAQIQYADAVQTLDASALERPADFAALATNAQQGFFADADYARTFSARLSSSASMQFSKYAFAGASQNASSAQANVSYALSSHVSMNAGAQYASLGSQSLSLPLSLQFHDSHFSASADYQPATNLAGSVASGYGASVGITGTRVSVSAFYRHNVEIPTLAVVFSQVPGLQAALDASGISVTSPADMAALLNNAALLSKLGFSNLRLDMAPARNDTGVNALWTSSNHMQHVSFSYLNSNAVLLSGDRFGFRLASLTYLMQMGSGNELSASVALLNRTPSYGITLRRRLSSAPNLLFPAKRGTIDGYVFEDENLSGTYAPALRPLAGVSVTLDGSRTAVTDTQGHYTFTGIPYGEHQMQAALPRGGYFTTDSPATAQIGDTINFGVSFVRGRLFGSVTNDAGAPIPGAVVSVNELSKSASAGDDGAFVFNGVPAGTYTLQISADSLPPGYDLGSLKSAIAQVNAEAPAAADLTVRALRSVSGTVTLYDPRKGVIEPAPGMDVTISELGLTCRTNENGEYAFRNLPAGTFAMEIDGGGASERRTITLSAQPETLTGIDYRVTVIQALQRQRLPKAR
jgi:hypothetical protein